MEGPAHPQRPQGQDLLRHAGQALSLSLCTLEICINILHFVFCLRSLVFGLLCSFFCGHVPIRGVFSTVT